MPDIHVVDDARRYETLSDRVNVYKEKWIWRESRRGERETIESDLIGHHVRVAPEAEEHYFMRCTAKDGFLAEERISTGPFIPRF